MRVRRGQASNGGCAPSLRLNTATETRNVISGVLVAPGWGSQRHGKPETKRQEADDRGPAAARLRQPRTEKPQAVVRVNFGVFTGREATPAEIDRLAEWLLDRVDHVTIVSETHHEIAAHSEAAVHQVRIEVNGDAGDDGLEQWLVDRAELWARECIAERQPSTPP